MRAYIDVSEDPIVGNAQPSGIFLLLLLFIVFIVILIIVIYCYLLFLLLFLLLLFIVFIVIIFILIIFIYVNVDGFWKRVESLFYNLMGEQGYRTNHQIYTKCTNLKTKVTRFAAIYNQLCRSRSSGSSDADVLTLAYKRYKEETNQAFCHEHCWTIIKNHPKWSGVPTMSTGSSRGTKRSKTSDDSDARFNLDDDDDDNEDEAQEPQRPIGRNKAKRATTSTTTGSNADDKITQLVDTITNLSNKVDSNLEYKMKKLDLKLSNQRMKDYNFFMTPHDHLTGIELEVTKKLKEEIKMKYNW
jgi:hypothetical protein